MLHVELFLTYVFNQKHSGSRLSSSRCQWEGFDVTHGHLHLVAPTSSLLLLLLFGETTRRGEGCHVRTGFRGSDAEGKWELQREQTVWQAHDNFISYIVLAVTLQLIVLRGILVNFSQAFAFLRYDRLMFGHLGSKKKSEGRSGAPDKRVESSGGEWRGSNRLYSCWLLFGEIPHECRPRRSVRRSSARGLWSTALLWHGWTHLCCFYTINAPRLKTAPFKTTTKSLETPQTSPEYDAPLFYSFLSSRTDPVPNHNTCLTKCFGVRFHPVSSADEDWFITDI